MRILMYCSYFPPHYSGAAKQGIELAKQLRKRGHYIEFVTVQRGNDQYSDSHDGFKVWRLKRGRGKKHQEFRLWFNFFLFLFSRHSDFDVLHSHGAYYLNSIIGPLGRLFRIKSLVKATMAKNDLATLGRSLTGRIHNYFMLSVDAYIAISKELQDEFAELGFPSDKVFVIPNGVDTDRFKPLDPRLKSTKRVTNHQSIAITVGVFDKRKNIGWLIREWIKNEGFGTGALLLAVGPQSREDKDGCFLRSLQELADSRPELVRIDGHTDNIEDYFRCADFLVLPSNNEGMPNVVLEAMASGLPCITTCVSGCTDLIQEGKNGFMFQSNDPEGLSEAIKKLSCNDICMLGENARHFVTTNYSLNSIVDRYEALYLQLTSNDRR